MGCILVAIWLPFGPFRLALGFLLVAFGSLLLTPGLHFLTLGSPSFIFFYENRVDNKDFRATSHQNTSFYAPELARPLQITLCTLTFAKHTIFLGPERVYCRRQLRSQKLCFWPPHVAIFVDFKPTFRRSKTHQNSDSSKILPKSNKFGPRAPNVRFFMDFGSILDPFSMKFSRFFENRQKHNSIEKTMKNQ